MLSTNESNSWFDNTMRLRSKAQEYNWWIPSEPSLLDLIITGIINHSTYLFPAVCSGNYYLCFRRYCVDMDPQTDKYNHLGHGEIDGCHRFWWEHVPYDGERYERRLSKQRKVFWLISNTIRKESITPMAITKIVEGTVEILRNSTGGYAVSPINGQMYEENHVRKFMQLLLDAFLGPILKTRDQTIGDNAYRLYLVRKRRGMEDNAVADWLKAETEVDVQIWQILSPQTLRSYPKMDKSLSNEIQFNPRYGVFYKEARDSFEQQRKTIDCGKIVL